MATSESDKKKEEKIRKVKINAAAIIGAVWTGVLGFTGFAEFVKPDPLADLVFSALVIGAVLTIAVLVYGIVLVWIAANSPGGVVVEGVAPPKR